MVGLTWGRDEILPDTYGECVDPCLTHNVTCDDSNGKSQAEHACRLMIDQSGIFKVMAYFFVLLSYVKYFKTSF